MLPSLFSLKEVTILSDHLHNCIGKCSLIHLYQKDSTHHVVSTLYVNSSLPLNLSHFDRSVLRKDYMCSFVSSFASFWHKWRDEEMRKYLLISLSCSLTGTSGHSSTFFAVFTKVKEN